MWPARCPLPCGKPNRAPMLYSRDNLHLEVEICENWPCSSSSVAPALMSAQDSESGHTGFFWHGAESTVALWLCQEKIQEERTVHNDCPQHHMRQSEQIAASQSERSATACPPHSQFLLSIRQEPGTDSKNVLRKFHTWGHQCAELLFQISQDVLSLFQRH
jgi:hypothetical protein